MGNHKHSDHIAQDVLVFFPAFLNSPNYSVLPFPGPIPFCHSLQTPGTVASFCAQLCPCFLFWKEGALTFMSSFPTVPSACLALMEAQQRLGESGLCSGGGAAVSVMVKLESMLCRLCVDNTDNSGGMETSL